LLDPAADVEPAGVDVDEAGERKTSAVSVAVSEFVVEELGSVEVDPEPELA